MYKTLLSLIFVAMTTLVQACVAEAPLTKDAVSSVSSEIPNIYNTKEDGLKSSEFKLPLSPDYKWGVSQSWG